MKVCPKLLLLAMLVLAFKTVGAQTLGGNTVFHFINQPANAQVSALGGVNITNISNNVSSAFHNPALLRQQMNGWVSSSFNAFYAGIHNYSIFTSTYSVTHKTSFGLGIQYFNYGNITQTDAAGNQYGTFRATDYVIELMAAKQHKQNWHYGATVKFIQSAYGQYKSNGLAADVGLLYFDTVHQVQTGILIKNMGTQLRTYSGTGTKEELPFDIQAGITKRLLKAPIQFSLTAHHLQAFNVHYNDTLFNQEYGSGGTNKKFALQNVLSHLVIAAQLFVGDKIEISTGYNFLRRNDLNIFNTANGLNGFTLGGGLLLKHLQIRYGTGFYQQNIFNHFTVDFKFK